MPDDDEVITIRGDRAALIDGVLASAPGMHRSTAEQIVDDHLNEGYTEICFRRVNFSLPKNNMSPEQTIAMITELEEALGGQVYRDPE